MDTKQLVDLENILPALIINRDQTAINYGLPASWTREYKSRIGRSLFVSQAWRKATFHHPSWYLKVKQVSRFIKQEPRELFSSHSTCLSSSVVPEQATGRDKSWDSDPQTTALTTFHFYLFIWHWLSKRKPSSCVYIIIHCSLLGTSTWSNQYCTFYQL